MNYWLFLIILIEGYVVLATELLAIRQLIPFVGSGAETIAIVISAVLLPLAVGYHVGGKRRSHIRKCLLRNVVSALLVLTFGLSYLFLELFFSLLTLVGIVHPIVQTFIYAVLFLSMPIFLLGQTVPLVSNYFGRTRIAEITGRMLFFSTVGSFVGSVFSTLVLMNVIGVHYTVLVTLSLLALLIPLLTRRGFRYEWVLGCMALGIATLMNHGNAMQKFNIVADNRYSTAVIRENTKNGERILTLNRSTASGLDRTGKRIFAYIQYIEKIFIDPIAKPGMPPREMLIIGAGGFTVGLEDRTNRYTFVDIDATLKATAERYFLRAPLSPNKRFIPASARAFVRRDQGMYDFILIDTYTHVMSVPMETTTEEFLRDARRLLKPGGTLVVNQIGSPDFKDRFSVRYDHVFARVFGIYTRQVVGDYNPWDTAQTAKEWRNILYIYHDRPYNDDQASYTDDKNTYSLDRY